MRYNIKIATHGYKIQYQNSRKVNRIELEVMLSILTETKHSFSADINRRTSQGVSRQHFVKGMEEVVTRVHLFGFNLTAKKEWQQT